MQRKHAQQPQVSGFCSCAYINLPSMYLERFTWLRALTQRTLTKWKHYTRSLSCAPHFFVNAKSPYCSFSKMNISWFLRSEWRLLHTTKVKGREIYQVQSSAQPSRSYQLRAVSSELIHISVFLNWLPCKAAQPVCPIEIIVWENRNKTELKPYTGCNIYMSQFFFLYHLWKLTADSEQST